MHIPSVSVPVTGCVTAGVVKGEIENAVYFVLLDNLPTCL